MADETKSTPATPPASAPAADFAKRAAEKPPSLAAEFPPVDEIRPGAEAVGINLALQPISTGR